MLLEKNGKSSSGKRTKHINMRYFFVTDRISKGHMSIAWCSTGDMIGDFFTKPYQGALFKKFRDSIMGTEEQKEPGLGKPKANKKFSKKKLTKGKKGMSHTS